MKAERVTPGAKDRKDLCSFKNQGFNVPTPTVLLLPSLKVLLVYLVMILLLPTAESPMTTTLDNKQQNTVSTIRKAVCTNVEAPLCPFRQNYLFTSNLDSMPTSQR